MIKYLIFFLIAAVISFLSTPLIRLLAQKLRILDIPSERKIHKSPVPLLGGIPIFAAFNLTMSAGILFNFEYLKTFTATQWISIFLSELIILGVGIYDDVKKVKPRTKFLFQLLAGMLLVLFGFGITYITNPFSGAIINLGFLGIPLTILWVVGITNALNLVDGLDGLAAGTSLIACIAIFGISFIHQNIAIALTSLVLAGSILGFLRYNFHPAKIFLGDSGSLLLGFLLAVLSLKGSSKGATLISVLAPILALGLPIMDTLLAMLRRFLKSVNLIDYANGNREKSTIFIKGFSMFKPDKDHIHHRILRFGFSHQGAVIFFYGICAALCGLGFLIVLWANHNTILFLVAVMIAAFIGIKSLNYKELKVLENGLFLPLYRAPLFNKKFFCAFIDLLFISLAYYLSFNLIFPSFGSQVKVLFIKTLPIVLALKMVIFYLTGMYKGKWLHFSTENLVRQGKALFLSSLSAYLILSTIFGKQSFSGALIFIVDFYILLSLVAGLRISYRLLDYFYNRANSNKEKKVLICGANGEASFLLDEIRYNGLSRYKPVGFVDDDGEKKGKSYQGYPVLGTYEDLDYIFAHNGFSEVIVSDRKIGSPKLKKLAALCQQKGVELKQLELKLESLPTTSH